MQLLLERGDVDVNAANDSGETALMRAADEGHASVIRDGRVVHS